MRHPTFYLLKNNTIVTTPEEHDITPFSMIPIVNISVLMSEVHDIILLQDNATSTIRLPDVQGIPTTIINQTIVHGEYCAHTTVLNGHDVTSQAGTLYNYRAQDYGELPNLDYTTDTPDLVVTDKEHDTTTIMSDPTNTSIYGEPAIHDRVRNTHDLILTDPDVDPTMMVTDTVAVFTHPPTPFNDTAYYDTIPSLQALRVGSDGDIDDISYFARKTMIHEDSRGAGPRPSSLNDTDRFPVTSRKPTRKTHVHVTHVIETLSRDRKRLMDRNQTHATNNKKIKLTPRIRRSVDNTRRIKVQNSQSFEDCQTRSFSRK